MSKSTDTLELIRLTIAETLAAVATPAVAAPVSSAGLDTLTETERSVVGLVCLGKSNREIGDALVCTMETAKSHVFTITSKLAIELGEHPNRTRLAYWGAKHGF